MKTVALEDLMYEPETLEEALEIIADLEYENSLLKNETQDLRDELRAVERDLAAAEQLVLDLKEELGD